MKYFSIRKFLPYRIQIPLWGDRKKWGLTPIKKDKDWKEWQKTYDSFYSDNQRSGNGLKINDAGYKIILDENDKSKNILEIGPGDIRHLKYWKSKPKRYFLADIDEKMILKGQNSLFKKGFIFIPELMQLFKITRGSRRMI